MPDRPDPAPTGDPLQLGVLLYPGVEPLDAVGPAQTFWVLDLVRPFVAPFAPVRVHLVAEHTGPVAMSYGAVLHATTSYRECPALDVLVVPGGGGDGELAAAGTGRDACARHEPTIAFVSRQAAGATLTASVCTGAFILAAAGLLAGRRVTTHWTARDELAAFMAARGEEVTVAPERLIDEGPVMTAGGISSGIDLGLHVIGRLLGPQVRDAARLAIELETPGAA